MTDPTKQAATAKTARGVIAEHYAAVEKYMAWAYCGDTPEKIISNARGFHDTTTSVFARSALALRALLDAPEGSVVDAEKALTLADGWLDTHDDACRSFCKCHVKPALAALRASPESLGSANVDLVYAERDIVALKRERDTLKADLAAARGETFRLQSALTAADDIARGLTSTPPPLSDRAKWVAQYIKEHVSLDEDSARVLAKEGAEILRIAEQAVKDAAHG